MTQQPPTSSTAFPSLSTVSTSRAPDPPAECGEYAAKSAKDRAKRWREKQKREKQEQQERREKRERNEHYQRLTRAIREGETSEALLAAVAGAIDSVGNSDDWPAETLSDACWNCFVEVAQLANDEDVPKATRLAYAQTLVHAAAVAEYRLAVESDSGRTQIAENLNYDEVIQEMLEKDRVRLVNAVRKLVEKGEIGIDEIDRPPDVVDD